MDAMKEVLDIDASGSVVLLNGSAIFDNDPCAMFRTHNCHVCDSPPADGQKLQKCKGCNIALYCSRSCQKSAWETHRYVVFRTKEGPVALADCHLTLFFTQVLLPSNYYYEAHAQSYRGSC